jgi:endonuclease/exonuclease/phosphatase family metal-dependent hydrolase
MQKRYVLLILILVMASAACGQLQVFLTYNIRYNNPADGNNSWEVRKSWLCSQVQTADPVIFGIQEGLAAQVAYIDSVFSTYRYIGAGRDDGKSKGEYCAIFYNTNKVKALKNGTFWLSPTPGKVSKGWDAALERICTYGLFRDLASGRKFWVFNTHFDHIGELARKNSAALILRKINTLNRSGFPVILMGDFNSDPSGEPVKIIMAEMTDSKVADKSMSMGPDGTFNGFGTSNPPTERIDFIFTGHGARPENYGVIRESHGNRYASDHYPVVATIRY